MKIKVAELFFSLQGEGRFVGVPSIFLRTFGCNFTCSKFSRLLDDNSPAEVDAIAERVSQYATYKDLPLVQTGCDSYASWHPAFKHLSPVMSISEIADRCMELLPYHAWKDEHLVITGGEPLLGWQKAYPELLDHADMWGLQDLTFETNGTQPLQDDLKRFLESWNYERSCGNFNSVTFSVSPKLSCSGESREQAICPEIVDEYQNYGHTYLKYVVSTEEDVTEVLEVTELYKEAGFIGNVYLMPLGGTEDSYHLNNRKVAELALKYGLRYSDRLQVPLFKNAWGT